MVVPKHPSGDDHNETGIPLAEWLNHHSRDELTQQEEKRDENGHLPPIFYKKAACINVRIVDL